MAVPATTGVLREKVSEMEIGDYIACEYGHQSLGAPTFKDFGTTRRTIEVPAAGLPRTAANTGYLYYFIKVEKGILVGYRVCMNTVSWDVLNNAKLIQGVPFDTGNIIPTMTSNTSPSGVASASSEYSDDNSAHKAFDKSNSTVWLSSEVNNTHWLQYKFNQAIKLSQYRIHTATGYQLVMPKEWVIEASNNGIDWTILDMQVNQTSWLVGTPKSFSLRSNDKFTDYRLRIIGSNANAGGRAYVPELEMYETAGIIRSLTGGVAYADEHGNRSTTDKGFGAWPQNNEWDKYIANFPQELIQEGKTLDDVFHYNTVITSWMQDTVALTISPSTNRAVRGYASGVNGQLYFSKFLSNTSANYVGLRPVFEFRE